MAAIAQNSHLTNRPHFPERLTCVAPAASQVSCWEFMETKGCAAAYYLLLGNHFIQCQSTYFLYNTEQRSSLLFVLKKICHFLLSSIASWFCSIFFLFKNVIYLKLNNHYHSHHQATSFPVHLNYQKTSMYSAGSCNFFMCNLLYFVLM